MREGIAVSNPTPQPAVEPLAWSLEVAAASLSMSQRHPRRPAAAQALPPGCVIRTLGRRLLFNAQALRKWVAEGCPADQPKKRR
jgi:hypothetical protein